MIRITFDAPPILWDDGLAETKLEAELRASLDDARKAKAPAVSPTEASHQTTATNVQPITSAGETLASSDHSQLIAGCGIAAVDGYLQVRDYAAKRGLDLIEFHHKGIDLQDLISTLVIHTQRMAELEAGAGSARRFRR